MMAGIAGRQADPETEVRERLAPTPEAVAHARLFIATTLTRWDAAAGTVLSLGCGRRLPHVVRIRSGRRRGIGTSVQVPLVSRGCQCSDPSARS